MRVHEFRRLMGLVDTLSSDQRSQLVSRLQSGGGEQAVTQMIETRMEVRPCCPNCALGQVVRNGNADALQRFQCRDCGRTFNALRKHRLNRSVTGVGRVKLRRISEAERGSR